VAKLLASTRSFHGDDVIDEYAWLRDREDPDTLAHLEAENAYTLAMTAHTTKLQAAIFDEIKTRTLETDLSVPSRKGDWFYYSRTAEGSQYGISCRSRTEPERDGTAPGDEVVLLDQNELAGDSPYFALGAFDVSPDGDLLAYSTDYDGSEKYTLRVKDLRTGDLRPDEVPGTYYGTAWSKDGSTLFYATVDAAMRPYRIWRHRLGTDAAQDEIVHEETDERFYAGVGLSRSEEWLVLEVSSKITSEVRVLRADDPLGDFQIVEPRRHGVEYSLDHSGDTFWILHNDGAENFELARTPVDAPGGDSWETVLAHSAATRLDGVHAFAGHLAISLRRDGVTSVRILPLEVGPDPAGGSGGVVGGVRDGHEIELPEEVRTVGVSANPEFETATLRIGYTSLVTPSSVYDYDLGTRELQLRKRQPVLGGVDLDAYESTRDWAVAADGTRVPISLVWRRGTPRDGTAPVLLYGYGSYEASMDPWFSIARLSLLDRGVIFAIAHVRGGGEMGRQWYEQGKLTAKRTTFTDFLAAADRLVEAGWAAPDRIVTRGGSAGGLLMGAVANLAPDRFAGIVAEVPFVDALSTILDPTLPLTVMEWEEWGNPVESPEVYAYMRSYSPYENVTATAYPAILATAGLNDPRVGYHEPAKWVARLRATATGDKPLLLKTELGAATTRGGTRRSCSPSSSTRWAPTSRYEGQGASGVVGGVGAW
jgi:oligopeptidase B